MDNNLKQIALALSVLFIACPAFPQSRTDEIVDSVRNSYAPDARVAVWEIVLQERDNDYIVSGKIDNALAKTALLNSLAANGFSCFDNVRLLPDSVEIEKPWALVTLSVACIRAQPRSAAELVSQAIMGTPMRVLERLPSDYWRVQTPDGYIGYVTGSSLSFLTEEDFVAWKAAERLIVTTDHSLLFEKADGDEACIVSDLVLGNIVEKKSEEETYMCVSLPDGRRGYVPKKDVQLFSEWSEQSFDMKRIENTARRMMGTPYLWGGMSTKSADCSGFVRTAYFSNGIILQRDASQQATTGLKIDCNDWQTIAEPGDLIFIGTETGRVTHVALYLGNGKYIHSSGRVKINSMDSESPDYLDYIFLSMSRIKGQVGTAGITAVKAHPWYFNLK